MNTVVTAPHVGLGSTPVDPYVDRRSRFELYDRALAGLDAPLAVVDLEAYRANADDLVRRAAGKPIRVASKSIRCRSLIDEALARPGFQGVLAYTLPEALWLADTIDDVVVGYPTAHRAALHELGSDDRLVSRVTIMVDDVEQLRLVEASLPAHGPRIRVCIDIDASLRLAGGRVHVGPRRSPVHSVDDAVRLARAVQASRRFALVGMMAYEGQIAGVGDNAPGLRRFAVRGMQTLSAREIAERRAAVVDAVSSVAPLEFVNGGGTGSLESTAAERAVTEVAAGSGLLAPHLFDHYTRFHPRPAAFFALTVVRRPAPGYVTVLGGGWIASGAAGRDRLPLPVWPEGLTMLPAEGAGEVQTPLRGAAADSLAVGDLVWFRHTKAGELCEHLDELQLVAPDGTTSAVPTYRGEGKVFL